METEIQLKVHKDFFIIYEFSFCSFKAELSKGSICSQGIRLSLRLSRS